MGRTIPGVSGNDTQHDTQHDTQDGQTRAFIMRACPKCAYPGTPNSRDGDGRAVCPECGQALGPVALDAQQAEAIGRVYDATRSVSVRFLGVMLAAVFLGESYASRVQATMTNQGFELSVIGGSLLLVGIAHALIACRIGWRDTWRLHLGWGLLVAALGIVVGTSTLRTPGAGQYLLLLSLFGGLSSLAWDVRVRALRFPIEQEARVVRALALRSLQCVIGLGVAVIACTLLLHPQMRREWTTLSMVFVGLGIVFMFLQAYALAWLRQAAERWRDPIEVGEAAVDDA